MTPRDLSRIIAAVGGDMRAKTLLAEFDRRGIYITNHALTDILQWLDDEGLTVCTARRRHIPEWHDLEYVCECLRTDYHGIEFPTCGERNEGRHDNPDHVKPPKFVVVHDSDGLFNGFEISKNTLHMQFMGNCGIHSYWDMLYYPKKGEPVPCFGYGLEVVRKDTGEAIQI